MKRQHQAAVAAQTDVQRRLDAEMEHHTHLVRAAGCYVLCWPGAPAWPAVPSSAACWHSAPGPTAARQKELLLC